MLASGCTKLQPHLDSGKGYSYLELGEHPISISCPLVSPSTKALAGEMPLNYSTDESFGVYALYYPTGNFSGWKSTPGSMTYINGAEFSYDSSIDDTSAGSGAWSATPGYYWPKGGKMTFAAWSPYRAKNDCTMSYGPTGLQLTNFTTADKGSEQYDLLYSERSMNKTSSTGGTTYSGADINFRHALCTVRFKFRSSQNYEGGTSTVIKGVEILNVYTRGNFEENINTLSLATYSATP